jgi:phage terminase large subunit GpA-like protein
MTGSKKQTSTVIVSLRRPDNATDLLSKAIASRRQATILDKQTPPPSSKEEKTEKEERDLQRYKVRCTHCNELMDLTDNDLLPYRTDDETSETGNDDDDKNDDELTEEEREEYGKDRKGALAGAIANAAKRKNTR